MKIEDLRDASPLSPVESELRQWPERFRAEAAVLRAAKTPKATGGAIVYEDLADAIDKLLSNQDGCSLPCPSNQTANAKVQAEGCFAALPEQSNCGDAVSDTQRMDYLESNLLALTNQAVTASVAMSGKQWQAQFRGERKGARFLSIRDAADAAIKASAADHQQPPGE